MVGSIVRRPCIDLERYHYLINRGVEDCTPDTIFLCLLTEGERTLSDDVQEGKKL